jgi:hypothetical protein
MRRCGVVVPCEEATLNPVRRYVQFGGRGTSLQKHT